MKSWKILAMDHAASFKGRDGNKITGTELLLVCDVPEKSDRWSGYQFRRQFLTPKGLTRMAFVPKVGDEITIIYSEEGTVEDIVRGKVDLPSSAD